MVLSQDAFVAYKLDIYYNPKFERGIAYNDSRLGIDWGIKPERVKLSNKDSGLPLFKDAEYFEPSNYSYE